MAPGFRFYPTRTILEKSSDYNESLGSATSIYGCYATGRKLWVNYIENAKRIDKALLPDPRSKSFEDLAKSVSEFPDLRVDVCRSTKKLADDYKIEVQWYPEALHTSFNIGDPEKQSGWVHLEMVLPYTKANMRSSVTTHKTQNEEVVRGIWMAYQEMWKGSSEPDWEYINETLAESA